MFDLSQMTQILTIIGISAAILAGLLLVILLLELLLRRLAHHHVRKTDLDFIGRKVVVTKNIRPGRTGKISYDDQIADAVSDQLIRRGQDVLITAIDGACFRVLPVVKKTEPSVEESRQGRSDSP